MRRLPGDDWEPAQRHLREGCVNTAVDPGHRVLGHGPEELRLSTLLIPYRAEELAVIPRHSVVRVGDRVVLVRVAVNYELPAVLDHILERAHDPRRIREADLDWLAPGGLSEWVPEYRNDRHLKGNALRVQVVGHIDQVPRIAGGIHVFDTDQAATAGRMVDPHDVVKKIAENEIAILLGHVGEGRIGEIPQVPRVDDIRP